MLCRQHLSDKEFLVLWENYESGQLRSVHAKKNMRDEAECKAEFCVEKKKDQHRLAEALQIPRTLKCYQGIVFLVWY